MIWLITTASVLLIAAVFWAWWHRRETRRARKFRRAAEALDRSEEPLVFVATHFWFPALGKYHDHSEDAQKMLHVFAESLPDDALALVSRVDAARAQIAADGSLDDRRATALRALFETIAERGGLDDALRASMASGALDWQPGAADEDEGTAALTDAQRADIDRWRDAVANGRSDEVLQDIDSRIEHEELQGIYRAALLDCRGRALLALGRAQEAVRDFEAAAKLAPNRDFGPPKEP